MIKLPMLTELISKATRNEFREILTGFILRDIDMIFESAGIERKLDHTPTVGGQRRSLVEQYYANLDFSNPEDVRRLVRAYEEIIERLNGIDVINPEDLQKNIDRLLRRMERDGFRYEEGRFMSQALQRSLVSTSSLIELTEQSIREHIEKACVKVDQGDYAGAIANAYTLTEGFLKELLRRTDTEFAENEGDIRALYKLISTPLNLSPKGDHIENHLKAILDGLQKQIGGLYELSNKASDRHARRYNPAKRHAKLAVNATLTLCEFLIESYAHQMQRQKT